ncbi:MAG TPA: retropepsin-like aspartic protease [Longimicrobiales bacterium]|nr:retropepsin-like aspartic protease [Longimicrobiales bacterium]
MDRFSRTLVPLLLPVLLHAGGCDVFPGPDPLPTDTDPGAVAFRLAGPNGAALLVPVHLNGQGPMEFVFDTGATVTCVDASVAEALALPEVAAGTGVAIGARGAEQVRIVRVDSMRIGTATAHDLLACVTDLDVLRAIGPGVRGLVGLNFMKPFRVTLDFRAEQVTFTE